MSGFIRLTFRGASEATVRPAHRTSWKSWLHHLGCTTVVALCFAFFGDLVRAHAFHRLTGVQIRSQFTGKVLTDGTHWRESYGPGGKLLVEEMGQGTSTGSWRMTAIASASCDRAS